MEKTHIFQHTAGGGGGVDTSGDSGDGELGLGHTCCVPQLQLLLESSNMYEEELVGQHDGAS